MNYLHKSEAPEAMLGLTQTEVAEKAEITEDLPRTIETDGSKSEAPALGAVQHALEEAGIEFIHGNHPGVEAETA